MAVLWQTLSWWNTAVVAVWTLWSQEDTGRFLHEAVQRIYNSYPWQMFLLPIFWSNIHSGPEDLKPMAPFHRSDSSPEPHVHGVSTSANIWMPWGCWFHDGRGQRTNQELFSPRLENPFKTQLVGEDRYLYSAFPDHGLWNVLFVSPVQRKVLGSS